MSNIAVVTKNKELITRLDRLLSADGHNIVSFDSVGLSDCDHLYRDGIDGIVFDPKVAPNAQIAITDMLMSLGRVKPVVLIDEPGNRHWQMGDVVTVLPHDADPEQILASVGIHARSGKRSTKPKLRSIPYFNHHLAAQLMKQNGGLSILAIDASNLRGVELEYGASVYHEVKQVFKEIVFELWGGEGSFRAEDYVCRLSEHANVFVVFLNRSREQGILPKPGTLEGIADRVSRRINNALWAELFKGKDERRLPKCVKELPTVGVGNHSAMYNPCINVGELINNIIETAQNSARTQCQRVQSLYRELMQTLINRPDLLKPNYQGIFQMQSLTKELVDEVHSSRSIAAIEPLLFGFESLIRVQTGRLERFLGASNPLVDPRFLRPDVLFSLARQTKVTLELDQACIKHAADHSGNLPGCLMVNVLPRNLYFYQTLQAYFHGRKNIIFEISESEGISNIELMQSARKELQKTGFGIAADDFGTGFAGLQRVMSVHPDVIKLDRSLVQNINDEPVKQAYVSGLIEASKRLKCVVLAEGVETWPEAETLKGMGVDLIQGFLLHRPELAEKIEEQLAQAASQTVVEPLKKAS